MQIRINQKRKELRKDKYKVDIDEDMFWDFEESLGEKKDELCEEMPL